MMKCQKNRNLSKIEKKYNCDYDLIIRLYTMDKLYLTKSELNKYLKKRGEKQYPRMILSGKKVIMCKTKVKKS